jgi:hypothetical protein
MMFRLGRKRSPAPEKPHLKMRRYSTALPTAPTTCDYSIIRPAADALEHMYMNDTLGDCVIACMCHAQGVVSGNAGSSMLYTDDEVVHLYSAIGGYVDGDPSTDNGCNVQAMLNHWRHHGAPIGHHRITGWLAVDASNEAEVKQAAWLFENLVFGMELPDKWINPFPDADGFVWDAAGRPDPDNGHCVVGVGYNEAGVKIGTWGMTGTLTYAAVAKYADVSGGGELYAVLSPNIIGAAQAKAPNGFDWEQLRADLATL